VSRIAARAVGLATGVILGLALLVFVAYSASVSISVPMVMKASPTPNPSPSPTPKPVYRVIGEDRILSLWTRDGLGHACPISPTDALTADHVAVTREAAWGPGAGFAPYVVWGDQLGNTGTAQWQWSDKRRDLSLIRVVSGTKIFPAFLRRADRAPEIGDKVYVVGFKYGGGVGDETLEVKVTGRTAGMLVYSASPGRGSSGSCVLNARGEVVGINVWMLHGEGVALLVVGEDWATVPDQFLEGSR
jgi:hypothetical protein